MNIVTLLSIARSAIGKVPWRVWAIAALISAVAFGVHRYQSLAEELEAARHERGLAVSNALAVADTDRVLLMDSIRTVTARLAIVTSDRDSIAKAGLRSVAALRKQLESTGRSVTGVTERTVAVDPLELEKTVARTDTSFEVSDSVPGGVIGAGVRLTPDSAAVLLWAHIEPCKLIDVTTRDATSVEIISQVDGRCSVTTKTPPMAFVEPKRKAAPNGTARTILALLIGFGSSYLIK